LFPVRLIRNPGGEWHLHVDPEADHVSLATATPAFLLDFGDAPEHFVGGVPADFDRTRFTAATFSVDQVKLNYFKIKKINLHKIKNQINVLKLKINI
jgi:hypothetical protein